MNKSGYKKWLKPITVLILIAIVGFGLVMGINVYVEQKGEEYIVSAKDAPQADAILVLGAYVYPDGSVSVMLHDRLTTGFDLYEMGKSERIVVSGDHGTKDYDEVNTMKEFLVDEGVTPSHVFMDHAGFNTYESLYRARDIFQINKVIIVTQEYHLKRAVFVARSLGLEAYGVAADKQDYGPVMIKYEFREMLARNKDFLYARILKPKPTFLGETIPVTGDGALTDDQKY